VGPGTEFENGFVTFMFLDYGVNDGIAVHILFLQLHFDISLFTQDSGQFLD